jgi:toxin ParE1/3/4
VTKPVRVEAEVEEELRAAVAWYEAQRSDLGAALLAEVQRVIDLIENVPGVGAQVPRVRTRYETRRIPLRRFPYVVVYRERTEVSQVIAFAHTSRKPGYWRSR